LRDFKETLQNKEHDDEKHILPKDVGKCVRYDTGGNADDRDIAGDCSLIVTGYWRTSAMERPVTIILLHHLSTAVAVITGQRQTKVIQTI
jgi:hypothetical protein